MTMETKAILIRFIPRKVYLIFVAETERNALFIDRAIIFWATGYSGVPQQSWRSDDGRLLLFAGRGTRDERPAWLFQQIIFPPDYK